MMDDRRSIERNEEDDEILDRLSSEEDEDERVEPFRLNVRDRSDRRSAEKLWLVSYSDFMTIMMIFFLAMFGYSHMMSQKRQQAMKRPLAYKEFAAVIEEMQQRMADKVRLLDDVSKTTVELGENVLFESGSADLDANAKATLNEIAASIARVDGDIIVEGHTDDVPITSRKYRSNWELSAARAFSVVDQMSKAGIPPSRLAAWGFGENRPVVPNDNDEDRRRNRRIDIVVLKKKTNA
jgi:chemotaxis protein MotB